MNVSRLFFSIFFLLVPSHLPAIDLFLNYPGSPLQGGSKDDGRTGWSDVISVSSGIENNINIGSIATGGGAGKATFPAFVIKKPVDEASTGLFDLCAQGNHLNDMVLEVTKPGGASGPAVIYRIELKLVLVQSIKMVTNQTDNSLMEEVTFQYGAHRITTFTQNLVTGEVTQSGQHSWSRVLNTDEFAVE